MGKKTIRAVPTTIYFPVRDHRALKLEAAASGKSMSDIVVEALRGRSPTTLMTHEDDRAGGAR